MMRREGVDCKFPEFGRLNGRGQSTVEIALLLALVAVALAVFFTFIRAAVSSRIKGGTDSFGHGALYEPP